MVSPHVATSQAALPLRVGGRLRLRSNTDGELLDPFAQSPLDKHNFTAGTALQALHLRKSIRFWKARAKPKAGEASTLGAHRTLAQTSWTRHRYLRFSRR